MSSAAISSSNPAREPGYPEKDCLSCRIIGASAFIGLGGYAIMQAKKQNAFAKVRPAGGPMIAPKVTGILGTVFIGLGIGRLFMPPTRA
ncbi:hypothetical protein L486_02811 [Kwoniella mangroviensis CBS 10435]|uniref:Distal membrane-arm assembly complex protein 1-like domain-containing protein n=1 Tax=Kwoniella mangroviensis CBS 10435 TaxID=1331196 RepID=A0A1B9IX74_9TREE|nr:uncharacterized protein I203_01353 [Kwoniella mangroviensis CBS 8507]OCF60131.1 hypothetical protein L486_02811 [Kwoniella mangroviensis CBS 10435]OCF69496.1 hypothetical protein I203_01353 [Kwoniella mangroviensis CBS 8507]OCF72296.1 hypothetical protein I204_06675 [Kwoniella mangroviensis CBS 8886]